ncbi:MAG: NADAR family protein [Archangiaceae bacterium]|nr:NADAR family protein [Archangiaceae bacterium]
MAIRFFSVTGEFGAFSNFSLHPIRVAGVRWPTVEHFFQANKFVGTEQAELIRRARTPAIAAKLGRSRRVTLRRDWESVKVDVMRQALAAKFEQHDDLRVLLLSTGTEALIEDTDEDVFWGCGSDGRGRNELGRLLVELRERLRSSRGD